MITEAYKIPLYTKVMKYVLSKIESGEWAAGDTLPTEQELQDLMKVSRVTVRHAIEVLEHKGYVVKKQGKGTFVTPPKLSYPLPMLTSFSEDMRRKGFRPSSQIISVNIRTNPATAKIMGLSDMTQFLCLWRKRIVDDNIVLGVHECMINLTLLDGDAILQEVVKGTFEACLERHDGSLYKFMEQEHHVNISSADESLEALACSKDLAMILDIQPGSPILFLERITYTAENQPLEYVKMYNRADIYKYSVRLTR
jgi:GntR family transcriptional regulator